MRYLGVVLVTLALAAPAAARTNDPVVVPDGCGDIDTSVVKVNGSGVDFDQGRAAWHDISSITYTAQEGGGLDIAMQLCADVPAPQVFTNGWYVLANVGSGCYIQLGVVDDLYGNPTRGGKVYEDCESQDVLGRPDIVEVYSADLPATAWSVTGKTVSWHLTRGQLSFAQATNLKNVGGYTGDGARLTEVALGDAFSVNGPGTRDTAASQSDVTLG